MNQTMKREQVVSMVSELEMLGFLKTNGTACRFVSIVTRTPVVKIRAGNPWGAGKSEKGLYKVSKKIGVINANYVDSVARRIAAQLGVKENEVEYEPGETWYKHLTTASGNTLPVVHNKKVESPDNSTEYYLQYFPQVDKSESVYVNEAGEPVSANEVKPWLYKESPRSAFKPTVIAVKLANIHRLKASGVVIEMPELEEVQSVLAD